MKSVFADTSFFVAFLSTSEPYHAKAVEGLHSFSHIVTTNLIVIELGNFLCRSKLRTEFVPLVRELKNNPRVDIVYCGDELTDTGLDLYHDRPDKSWSITDCISFVVMRQMKLTTALTADHHFEQAGFSIRLS